MGTFKLVVSYDGSAFVGWQRQAAGASIQGELESALRELDGREVTVTGAGRTDAGVHALAQVASVSLERAIDGPALARAMNARLPPAIRVVSAEEAPPAFHARFDAVSKSYRYRIWNDEVLNPFERHYACHVPGPRLDTAAMGHAAKRLEGRHDFAAFQATGSDAATTERRVWSSAVHADGAIVRYEVRGDGFLRHMVRNIAGTLLEVGRGRHPEAWIDEVLAGRDRSRAGPTAPAHGLFLVCVEYAAAGSALAAER